MIFIFKQNKRNKQKDKI